MFSTYSFYFFRLRTIFINENKILLVTVIKFSEIPKLRSREA